jgi:hypothetical protein
MALTTRQRNALPRSAFAYAPKSAPRSRWRYPVPTKAQARRAGIGEAQRQRIAKSAVAYSAHRNTAGSRRLVEPVARQRAGATRKARPAGLHPRSRTRRASVTRARAGHVHRAKATRR